MDQRISLEDINLIVHEADIHGIEVSTDKQPLRLKLTLTTRKGNQVNLLFSRCCKVESLMLGMLAVAERFYEIAQQQVPPEFKGMRSSDFMYEVTFTSGSFIKIISEEVEMHRE